MEVEEAWDEDEEGEEGGSADTAPAADGNGIPSRRKSSLMPTEPAIAEDDGEAEPLGPVIK